MIDIQLDVFILSGGCMALAFGLYACLLDIKKATTWLRNWRIVLACGCSMALIGAILGIIRMTLPWHPYSGDLCALLLASGGLVATIAALGCLGVFGTSGSIKAKG